VNYNNKSCFSILLLEEKKFKKPKTGNVGDGIYFLGILRGKHKKERENGFRRNNIW